MVRLAWLGGQTGLHLILHLFNNSTLSTNRLSKISTFKKTCYTRLKNIFNDQIYLKWSKNCSKYQNQKNGEIKEIFGETGRKKNTRWRAFARTRAKKEEFYATFDTKWRIEITRHKEFGPIMNGRKLGKNKAFLPWKHQLAKVQKGGFVQWFTIYRFSIWPDVVFQIQVVHL